MTEKPTKEINCLTCRWFNPSYCSCYKTLDMLPRIVLHVCKGYEPKIATPTNIPNIRSQGITLCKLDCLVCCDFDCPSNSIHNEES